MAAGATVFRDTLISVIPAVVRVTSPTWSCRRRRSHPRQPYVRDCSGSSSNVAETTLQQTTESSGTASYPLFRRVFASRHGYYVQPSDEAIRHSVIYPSLLLLFLWPTGNHVLADDSWAFLLQVSVMRNVMPVMRTIRWDVNGIHASTIRNLIRREGSD
jgi:hypothetical protein